MGLVTVHRNITNLMMIMAHKIALNPTHSQKRLLWEHVGYVRFAANRAIEDFREGLADGEWMNDKTLRPRWNARKAELAPWATHLSQNAAKNAIRNVGKAVSRWGEHGRALREGRPARYIGFPSWRKRGVHDSIRCFYRCQAAFSSTWAGFRMIE